MARKKKDKGDNVVTMQDVANSIPSDTGELFHRFRTLKERLANARRQYGEAKDILDTPVFERFLERLNIRIQLNKDKLECDIKNDMTISLRAQNRVWRETVTEIEKLFGDDELKAIRSEYENFCTHNALFIDSFKRQLGGAVEPEPDPALDAEIAELRALDAKINEGIKLVLDLRFSGEMPPASDEPLQLALATFIGDSTKSSDADVCIVRAIDSPEGNINPVIIIDRLDGFSCHIHGPELLRRVRKIYNIAQPTAQIETIAPGEPTAPSASFTDQEVSDVLAAAFEECGANEWSDEIGVMSKGVTNAEISVWVGDVFFHEGGVHPMVNESGWDAWAERSEIGPHILPRLLIVRDDRREDVSGARIIDLTRALYGFPVEDEAPADEVPAIDPEEDELSDGNVDALVHRLFYRTEGAGSRIGRIQGTGATDKELRGFISHELGDKGSLHTEGLPSIDYKGSKRPEITLRWKDNRVELKEWNLLTVVRRVLSIEEPSKEAAGV